MNRMTPRTRALLGLVAVGAVAVATDLWWLRADHRPQAWDQSVHLTSAEHYRRMTWRERVVHFSDEHRYYPPLVALVGAAAGGVCGNTADGFTTAMLPFLLLLLAATYRLGLAVHRGDRLAALAGAALVVGAPLVARESRQFMYDMPLAALVAATAWALGESPWRGRRWVGVGVLIGLGMLVKWTFPFYTLAPLALSLAGSRAGARARRGVAAKAVALGFVVCAGWYLPNFNFLRHALFHAAYTGSDIVDAPLASWGAILFYPVALPSMIGWPAVLLAVAGAVALVRAPATRRWAWTVVVPLVIVTLLRNKQPRYFMPALPFILVGVGAAVQWITAPARRRWAAWGLTALAAVQFVVVAVRVAPPSDAAWPHAEVAKELAVRAWPGAELVVNAEEADLNQHTFEFELARLGLGVHVMPQDEGPGLADFAVTRSTRPHVTDRLYSELQRWPLADGSAEVLLRRNEIHDRELLRRNLAGMLRSQLGASRLEVSLGMWRDGTLLAGFNAERAHVILHADGVDLDLPVSDLAVGLGRVRERVGLSASATGWTMERVRVGRGSIAEADLDLLIRGVGAHPHAAGVRIFSRPLRSLLGRLRDPHLVLEKDRIVLAGRLWGVPLRLGAVLAHWHGGLQLWWTGVGWGLLDIRIPSLWIGRLPNLDIFAPEALTKPRLTFDQVRVFPGKVVFLGPIPVH